MSEAKIDVRFQILTTILSAEMTKGHFKWSVSDISRKLKVSRSLIYYHFGNSKKQILDNCYKLMAEEFYGLHHDFKKIFDFDKRTLEKSIARTRSLYLENPAIVIFFHRWRLHDSPVQKRILEMEKLYHAKLQNVLPNSSQDEVLAIHSVVHGVVTSPFANDESISHVVNILRPMLERGRKR